MCSLLLPTLLASGNQHCKATVVASLCSLWQSCSPVLHPQWVVHSTLPTSPFPRAVEGAV